jgi:hypothetical protein
MNTNQYIVGIDPDTEKNGYAIIDMETRKVSVETVELPHLIELIKVTQANADAQGKRLTVYVEAGWLCQSNWHIGWRDSKERAAAKGRSVGRNHQRGMDICELLKYYCINVVQVAPLRKIWGGKDYKITHDELVEVIGPVKHTNQEGRDAALLAWVHAGLPVKLSKH